MKLKNFNFFFLFIAGIILTLGLSVSFQSLLAAWTAPLASPPTCTAGNPGCDAPLNVGSLLQTKTGALWINTGVVSPYGLIVETGKVGLGAIAPAEKLEVNGNIKLSGASPTYKITNVAAPTATSDVATKAYVDAASGGRKILRYFSTSLSGDSISGPAYSFRDYQQGNIVVSGLPTGAQVRQATLFWEGGLQNSGSDCGEWMGSYIGFKQISAGSYTNVFSLGSGAWYSSYLGTAGYGSRYAKLVASDVSSIVTGNNTYSALLHLANNGCSSSGGSWTLGGSWALEIQYE